MATRPGFAATLVWMAAAWLMLGVITSVPVAGQVPPSWRQVGTFVIERSLAGPASGPISRVWYSLDASVLFIQTVQTGTTPARSFQTVDLENWQRSSVVPPRSPTDLGVPNLPEPGAHTRTLPLDGNRVYAFGDFVYRSDDGGIHWENLTVFRGTSLVGGLVHDLVIAPGNVDEITAVTEAGVFRSVDGGTSWSSLNDGLPDLPATRLLSLPAGDRGTRIGLANDQAAEWDPGQKLSWLPANNSDLVSETALRQKLAGVLHAPVSAVLVAQNFVYAGLTNGEIAVSSDRGTTWRSFVVNGGGRVERFWADAQDPRIALAALGVSPPNSSRNAPATHVVHTPNGGAFWDDVTGNLPDTPVHGVTADSASGALYAATDRGVFISYADLAGSPSAAPVWNQLMGLPATDTFGADVPVTSAMDVALDAQGNHLWVVLNGSGVYWTLAPHRLRNPKVVSAADLLAGAVAPGSLVSILGARVDSVRAGTLSAPVLATSSSTSEIQIPFDAQGSSFLFNASNAGSEVFLTTLPLVPAAPSIFVSPDGFPMLVDEDKGALLDSMNPAHAGSRIQILASGLGQVTPAWPAGLAAPLSRPPRVSGTVHAYVNGTPVEVVEATLAPGYPGVYQIEITVPKIVNYGPAELHIDVDGALSNRVRVYIEP